MSVAFVDSLANQILDLMLGAGATLLPGTVYVGLLQSAPTSAGGSIAEPSGGGYARIAIPNNGTNWPAAVARQKTHAFDIAWGIASLPWGNITHAGIFDALTVGNLKLFGPLATPRTINAGDQFKFIAGSTSLIVSLPGI